MKNRPFAVSTMCIVFVALALAACSFGLSPVQREGDRATVSLDLARLDPVGDGPLSRAIAQGNGFLYIRALGGPAGTAGTLYGPYPLASGNRFETDDIPAGTYSKGFAILYSAIALPGLEAVMKLPDDEFLREKDSRTFIDACAGSASMGITPAMTIREGRRNAVSLTLIPIVNAALTVDCNAKRTYTVQPASAAESTRTFLRLDNVVASGSSATELTCVASGAGTIGSLALYDATGKLMGNAAYDAASRKYSVPYTSGSTFYLYIECSGGSVNLAFDAVYAGGGNVTVTLSGATAEAGRKLWFQLTPVTASPTAFGYGSFTIQSDGTGSGVAINILDGKPAVLPAGTYALMAFIDLNGNAVNGFDGYDADEPMYMSESTSVSSGQTTVALARSSFTVTSPYPGYAYFVSNAGGSDGSSPSSPTTFDLALAAIASNASNVDGKANWIVLTGNVVTSSASGYQFPASRTVFVTSDGSGVYSIVIGNSIASQALFQVVADATLTLTNVFVTGDPGNSRYAWDGLVSVATNGSLIMGTGATLTSNQTATNGPGVNVNGGSFVMTDGTVSYCTTTIGDGGGVYVNGSGATFAMSGGRIEYCSATAGSLGGGGVCVRDGMFMMSGGSIYNCSTTKSGGGVHVYNGTLSMSGGTISVCVSSSYGGGILIDGTMFSFGNAARVIGNTATGNGAGIYIGSNVSTFVGLGGSPQVTGNAITDNNDYGVGVCYRICAAQTDVMTYFSGGFVSGNFFNMTTPATREVYNLP